MNLPEGDEIHALEQEMADLGISSPQQSPITRGPGKAVLTFGSTEERDDFLYRMRGRSVYRAVPFRAPPSNHNRRAGGGNYAAGSASSPSSWPKKGGGASGGGRDAGVVSQGDLDMNWRQRS